MRAIPTSLLTTARTAAAGPCPCLACSSAGLLGGPIAPPRDRGDSAIPRGVGVFLEEYRDLLGEIGGHRGGAGLRLHLGNGLPDFDSLYPRSVFAGEGLRVGGAP